MKKKPIALALLFTLTLQSAPAAVVDRYDDGYLEYVKDVPVLHLKGSEYEMGKQYGHLVGERVADNIENLKKIGESQDARIRKLPKWAFKALRRVVGFAFWLTFPKNVKTHIKGMVQGAKEKGTKLNKYDVAFLNSVIDIVGILKANTGTLPGSRSYGDWVIKSLGLTNFTQQCDSMAAWGSRTVDGKTYQTRNTDISTGAGIEKYPLVVVYKPEGKVPFITAVFSGMVGMFTGMNAHGVGLGQVWAFSKDVALTTPWNIVMRGLFSESASAKEVVKGLMDTGVTTYGNNFVIADGGDHSEKGFVVEMTAKSNAVFTDNDPRELVSQYNGESYGLPLKESVFRGDLSLDPQIRKRQIAAAGPDGDPRNTLSYKLRYKGQWDLITAYEQNHVLIGQKEAETISRETAIKDGNLQAAVYANSERDFWVAYAKMFDDGTVLQAYQREYVNVPFHSYLVELSFQNNELTLKNWFKSREGLTLKVFSKNGQKSLMTFTLGAEEVKNTGVQLDKGDVAELYDGEQLIDRLEI